MIVYVVQAPNFWYKKEGRGGWIKSVHGAQFYVSKGSAGNACRLCATKQYLRDRVLYCTVKEFEINEVI